MEVYVFRVIQNLPFDYPKIRNMPTVELEVPSDYTLFDFADMILQAFDFELDHMFGFYDNWKNYYESKECYELFVDEKEYSRCKKGVKKTKLKNVFKEPKKRMLMIFDYGEEWPFIIDFLKSKEVKDTKDYPKITKRKGEPFPQYPDFDEEEDL